MFKIGFGKFSPKRKMKNRKLRKNKNPMQRFRGSGISHSQRYGKDFITIVDRRK